MDGKKTYRHILFALLFLAVAEACFFIVALYRPFWDPDGIFMATVFFAGIIFTGLAVNTIMSIRTALVRESPKRALTFEGRGRLLQYRAKK